MKPNFLLSLWLLAYAPLGAQSPVFSWVIPIVDRSDPANTYADLFDMQTHRESGETVVLGYFQGKVDFDAQHSVKTPEFSWAYFLTRYRSDGTVRWTHRIGPIHDVGWPTDTTGGGVEIDEAGNVYVTAKFFSQSLDFGNGSVITRHCPSDCADIFLAKYSPDGQLLWAKTISSGKKGLGLDADGVVWDKKGYLYLSGSYNGNELIYDKSTAFTDLSYEGCFLARLSGDGHIQWLRTTDQQGIAVSEHLQLAANGDIWWGGYYLGGEIKFGNNMGLEVYGNPDYVQYFLARYSSEGEAQEALNFNSGDELFFMPDIATAPDSSLLIVHDFRKSLSQANIPLKQISANGSMLTRYKNGTLEQAVFIPYGQSIVAPVSTPISALATSPFGQVLTGGYFGTPSLVTPAGVLQGQGCSDIMLLSLAGQKSPVQGYRFGKNGCEGILNFYTGHSMRFDSHDALYICGLFAEEMTLGAVNQIGYGLFIAKLDQVVNTISPDVAPAASLLVQPNPGTGKFVIGLHQSSAEGFLTVQDVQGRLVHTQSVQTTPIDLYLQAPTGLYFCTFYGEKGMERGKLLLLGE